MKTGFLTFDKNISELEHGELIAFVERPAMGVDMFLNQLCFRVGEDYKICYFKFLTHKDYYPFPKLDEKFGVTVDNRILNFSELLLICTKIKLEKGLDVVIINDLYLLRVCSGYSVDKLIRLLKDMATALGVAVIIHSYFKRQPYKRRDIFPTIDDLREYELMIYADKVISFYRPDVMCSSKDLPIYIKDGKRELRIMPFKDNRKDYANSFKLYMGIEKNLIYDLLDTEEFSLFERHIFYN